jgi:hypothetical protein
MQFISPGASARNINPPDEGHLPDELLSDDGEEDISSTAIQVESPALISAPFSEGAMLLRRRAWWAAEAGRVGTDWRAVGEAALTMLVAAGILEEPEASVSCWDAPSWRESALNYHRDRPRGHAIEPERLARLRRLMADDFSLERAWHELRDNRPTPEVTVEAIRQSVRERWLKELDEQVNQEQLGRCDAEARARLDRWLTNFQKGNC